MPDLNSLESFVIAAETLNFSETAARRNTVQSAISTHIRRLESEIGRPLFDRGRGRPMRLTPEGQALAAYARRILSLTDEAFETIRNARSLRTIRLGTTVTLTLSVLPRALAAFARQYPDAQIHVFCDRSDALLDRLDAGEIDLAFMMDQGKRQGRMFAENTPLVWAGSSDFDPRAWPDIPLVFLTDGRDLRRHAFEALDRAGRSSYIAHLSPHPVGVRAFVLAGLALTVMPAPSVAPPLKTFDQTCGLPQLSATVLSLYRKSGYGMAELDALADLLNGEIVASA